MKQSVTAAFCHQSPQGQNGSLLIQSQFRPPAGSTFDLLKKKQYVNVPASAATRKEWTHLGR